MKNKISEILFGKGKGFNGLIALIVVGLFVLGCNCNKLTNQGQDNPPNNPPSNTTNPVNTGTPPQKQTGQVPKNSNGETPSEADMTALVQDTLQEFTDAVDAADFTNFRESVSRPFKQQFSADQFKTSFQGFIDKKTAVVPILRSTGSMTPSYSPAFSAGREKGYKVLTANGRYSTSPLPTNFDLKYVLEGKEWKLIEIKLRIQN